MLTRIQNGLPADIRQGEYLDEETPLPRITDLTDIDNIKSEVKYLEEKIKASQALKEPLKEKAENQE